MGRSGRAVVTAYAELLDWPANSADLSPVEKAWAYHEHVLWRDYSWTTQAEFEVAMRAAWKVAITPSYCRALFGGLRGTLEVMAKGGGRRVKGWGASAVVA